MYDSNYYGGTTVTNKMTTGQILLFILLGIVLVVLLVSMVRLFIKADRKWWEALIPIYNIYVLIKIVDLPDKYLWLSFIPIVNIYIYYRISTNLAIRFGKESSFAVLIFFVPFVAFPMLAFSDCTYERLSAVERRLPVVEEISSSEPVYAVVASPESASEPINQSLDIATQSLQEAEQQSSEGQTTEEHSQDNVDSQGEVEASVQSVSSVSDGVEQEGDLSQSVNLDNTNINIEIPSDVVDISQDTEQTNAELTKLETEPISVSETKVCPKCGNKSDINSIICSSCGSQI